MFFLILKYLFIFICSVVIFNGLDKICHRLWLIVELLEKINSNLGEHKLDYIIQELGEISKDTSFIINKVAEQTKHEEM